MSKATNKRSIIDVIKSGSPSKKNLSSGIGLSPIIMILDGLDRMHKSIIGS